jgi:hypothetical protein
MRYFIMFLLCISTVLGLTASPASHNSNYGDGEQEYVLTVRNDEQRSLSVTLTPTGPLAPHITVDKELTLAPGESKQVQVRVELPPTTQPGVLESGILIESRPVSSGTVAATSAVLHIIRVTTPKEGAFVAGELLASTGIVQSPVAITFVLRNTGSVQTSGTASFTIAGQDFSQQQFSLEPEQVQNIVVYWTPQRVGEYQVAATATYAGKEEQYETTVIVGNLSVDIAGIELSDFRLGDPFRVQVNARSAWGAPLSVSAAVAVQQGNTTVQAGRSTAVRLDPLTTARIPVFVESTGLSPGIAFLSTSVAYNGQNKTAVYPVVIGVDSIAVQQPQQLQRSQSIATTVAVIILLVLIAGFWFIRRKK